MLRAVADASAFICSGDSNTDKAHEIAEATAEGFVLTVATASATCEVQGNAEIEVAAHASAEKAASFWVGAYFDAFALGTDCEHCEAFAGSFGHIETDIFLRAVADAKVSVCACHACVVHAFVFKFSEPQCSDPRTNL